MTKPISFLAKHKVSEFFLSLTLFSFSSFLSVHYHFPYFYSTFLIGLCFLLDSMFRFLKFPSLIDSIVSHHFLFVIAVIAIPISWIIDRFFGQTIFQVWFYPYYKSVLNQILLYCVVYPFGGLSMLSMYFLFQKIFERMFPKQYVSQAGKTITFWILLSILVLFPVAFFLPIVLHSLQSLASLPKHTFLYAVFAFFILIEWAFLFDTVLLLVRKRPVLLDIVSGNIPVLLGLVLGGLVNGFLNEYINTFSYEWVYVAKKVPVTTFSVFNVYLIVLISWILATVLCVSSWRLLMAFVKR